MAKSGGIPMPIVRILAFPLREKRDFGGPCSEGWRDQTAILPCRGTPKRKQG